MTALHPSESGRLDRLPTWARDLVTRLDRELTSVRDERDALYRTIGEPDGVGVDVRALRVPTERYLHVSERWTDSLRVRFSRGTLEVTSNGPMQIRTNASNVVEITEVGR